MFLVRDSLVHKRDWKDITKSIYEPMSWKNVANNCKAIYEYQFINGSDPNVRKLLIKIIAEEFPDYPRMRIAFAVDRCIAAIQEPMSPSTFLTFVKSYLG